MAAVSRWHYDINFKTPDGYLDMSQTLSYFDKAEAEKEKDYLITNMQRVGCTDIKPYLREIKQYVPYDYVAYKEN